MPLPLANGQAYLRALSTKIQKKQATEPPCGAAAAVTLT